MFERIECHNPGPCRGVSQPVVPKDKIDSNSIQECLGADPLTPEQATYPTVVSKGLTVLGVRGCIYATMGRRGFIECKAGIGKGSSPEELPTCLQTRMAINSNTGIPLKNLKGSTLT